MGQVRFNIGVPRAGSAARDAEASREDFRSLRSQAGSAARQAEEERRSEARGMNRPAGSTTIRMKSSHRKAADAASTPASPVARSGEPQTSNHQPTQTVPMQVAEVRGNTAASPEPFGTAGGVSPSLAPTPLQTAAAKFKSLFRSIFSSAASEN